MKFSFSVFLIIILIISCKTNPPSFSTGTDIFEKVFVEANVDSAEIFIDDLSTGKLTPDTIAVKVGTHIIKIIKDGYHQSEKTVDVVEGNFIKLNFILESVTVQKVVLLEDFANVSCDPCVLSNLFIESIKTNSFNNAELAVIKYPTNFPSPNDPFYTANSPDCDSRIAFYNVLFAPTIRIDGIGKPVSTDSNDVKEKITARLLTPAKFQIDVSDSISGHNIFIHIHIKNIESAGVNFNNLVLQTVVTEKEIAFTDPPGSNGETIFYNVMRVMLPSSAGENVSFLEQGGTESFNRQIQINSGWNKNELEVVVFLQDDVSKEIYQSGYSK